MNKTITPSKLYKLNLAAGFLHLVQAIVVLVVSKSFTIPVSANFLAFDDSTQTLQPASTSIFGLSLPLLIASFFFLSAFFHFFIATVYRKKYESDLKLGINRARWIEYSLSASIMMVAISTLVGVYDFSSLLMIFALTSVMNLMGLVMEVHNQTTKKTDWLSYNIGWLFGWNSALVGSGNVHVDRCK